MKTMRRARALMIQGTASHAGKSLLVAGLCRLFSQEGLKVVPFKSQNMALNAYVTRDGGEMGWAQAMQAEAAGLEPRVEMNPILLKPQSHEGSQVILRGKVLGFYSARDYYAMNRTLWSAVVESYETLARTAALVLIEGAGNPAEPNLMARDLANMAVARLARAPVLLVGDIDRGGVFGNLLGTLALLPPNDRKRVKGFIINKFRGDRSLLTPALEFLSKKSHRPVLGVVPHLGSLHLPEEDSVALDPNPHPDPRTHPVRIVVVRLPYIANFTDFAPLGSEPGVQLVYAQRPEELAGASLVLLPGSKNTIADLRFLKSHGFAEALEAHLGRGGSVGGICGGYQMLGLRVADPHGVESSGEEEGLGLLPVTTTLASEKVTQRVKARLNGRPWTDDDGGGEWDAYEIHIGRTEGRTRPLFRVVERAGAVVEEPEGAVSPDGRVWGTYLHGCLDAREVRVGLLGWLSRLALTPSPLASEDYRTLREHSYDSLAQSLRQSLDLPALLVLAGL
jgi:adenosylcobyric acid synthase